jgi:hypothetical protein
MEKDIFKKVNIKLKPFKWDNSLINEIRSIINKKYNDLFFCVIAHGSVATNEIIPYSDFDGLAIVKNEFIKSKKLKEFIKESMKIIYKFDPFQHHGWFIISDKELLEYPQIYFPHEILKYSFGIYPNEKINFKIYFNPNINYTTPLFNLINGLQKKITSGKHPKNAYQLKSFLSELMLIPAFYVQAKYCRGVFKKNSFNLAKKDFPDVTWYPIEISSKIRLGWSYKLNCIQKKISENQNQKYIRILFKNILAPRISTRDVKFINDKFYESCLIFFNEIHKKIEENYPSYP